MNVFRSLARDLITAAQSSVAAQAGQAVGSLQAVRNRPVARVLELSRNRDAFDRLPDALGRPVHSARAQFRSALSAHRGDAFLRDGFESGRRAPVNLSGGVKAHVAQPEVLTPAKSVLATGFTASLDDLG